MAANAFEDSAAHGRHAQLARMQGQWEGSTKVWFEPGTPPVVDATQRGSIRAVGGGRFLLHEYTCSTGDDASEGVALYAMHLDANAFEIAWVDTFHSGTSILFSTDDTKSGTFRALTHYGDGAGGPPWGWRTEIDQIDDDTLVIRMTNITPDGQECPAVETRYRRV